MKHLFKFRLALKDKRERCIKKLSNWWSISGMDTRKYLRMLWTPCNMITCSTNITLYMMNTLRKHKKIHFHLLPFHDTMMTQGVELLPHRRQKPGPWFNIKMPSYKYRKSHCWDKTVVRSSCLYNGISYTGKMASLYWIRATPKNILCHCSLSPLHPMYGAKIKGFEKSTMKMI